ncbi:hypothetical protein [Ramlibacter algicola]|uniref:Uncharacterized protein n=1 Tax=Ramlibacter algicola TaxID=2795217 RepID=A0A934Q579_9BURK|nr:hypothetical protein [Ramlibacter algicola]MBK0394484.1 hypothetical protein [Ramlibacter algicola]
MIQRLLPALLLAALGGVASAKIPAPPQDEAAKSKAAEAAAKTAWQTKVDSYKLCKSQDVIAAKYGNKSAAKASAAAASKPAGAASGPTSTPVAASVPPPCTDPGPFASNAPKETPLETSGAHSPAGTATKPPSVNATSGQMQPAKKSAN